MLPIPFSGGESGSEPPVPQAWGPTPPPTFQTWPGSPSLLTPPPPPLCDCKRQQTLHGSFTLINQPDGQARIGPTGWWVSGPSPCPGPRPHLYPLQTPGVRPCRPIHPPRGSQGIPDRLSSLPSIQVGKLRHNHTGSCVLRVSPGAYGGAVSGVQQDSAGHQSRKAASTLHRPGAGTWRVLSKMTAWAALGRGARSATHSIPDAAGAHEAPAF